MISDFDVYSSIQRALLLVHELVDHSKFVKQDSNFQMDIIFIYSKKYELEIDPENYSQH